MLLQFAHDLESHLIDQSRCELIAPISLYVIKAFPRDVQWWITFHGSRDTGSCSCRWYDNTVWLFGWE